MDETRTISFVDPDRDFLDEEVEKATKLTPGENLLQYCEVLSAQLAMQNIDLRSHRVERIIYFIE